MMALDMHESPTRTGVMNHISAVYHSKCHGAERTILEGQVFPRCGRCNSDTVWVFINPIRPPKPRHRHAAR
jgi:hypothetical protein